jgi:hypothetical protein
MADPISLEKLLEPYGCACPGCARSMEMARRLRKLRERHQLELAPHLCRAHLCRSCGKPFPCPDAQIIEGRE